MSSKLQITPAECRLRAAECHKMGQNARRPHVRDTLAEIERMWNRLAVEAEVSESMLTRFLEDTAFGPDEIAIMVAAYELGLTQKRQRPQRSHCRDSRVDNRNVSKAG